MMKLFCVVVGVTGSAFSVVVGEDQTVDDLKKAIKDQKPDDLKDVDADDMLLFLAKNEKEEWLSSKDPDVISMQSGGIPEQVKTLMNVEVDPADKIGDVFEKSPTMETVHVLVKIDRIAPNVELMSFLPTCWLVTGSAGNALNTRGVRSQMYRLADSELGYYDPTNFSPGTGNIPRAFWYENNDIQIRVLFKKEEHALYFQSHLVNDFSIPINSIVSEAPCPRDLQRIFRRHYVEEESGSPQLTVFSSEISLFDQSNPVFKYQRIEADGFFGSYGKAESAHLISASHCRNVTSYAQYDKDDNNRLALSREMHGAYDGINCDFPLVDIKVVSASEHAELDHRFKVELQVSVYSHEYAFLLARLKDESTKTKDPLVMKTFVYVQDKNIFCRCIQWKYIKNGQLREEFFAIDPRAT